MLTNVTLRATSLCDPQRHIVTVVVTHPLRIKLVIPFLHKQLLHALNMPSLYNSFISIRHNDVKLLPLLI